MLSEVSSSPSAQAERTRVDQCDAIGQGHSTRAENTRDPVSRIRFDATEQNSVTHGISQLWQRQCLGYEGSGNTGRRQCLSRASAAGIQGNAVSYPRACGLREGDRRSGVARRAQLRSSARAAAKEHGGVTSGLREQGNDVRGRVKRAEACGDTAGGCEGHGGRTRRRDQASASKEMMHVGGMGEQRHVEIPGAGTWREVALQRDAGCDNFLTAPAAAGGAATGNGACPPEAVVRL